MLFIPKVLYILFFMLYFKITFRLIDNKNHFCLEFKFDWKNSIFDKSDLTNLDFFDKRIKV